MIPFIRKPSTERLAVNYALDQYKEALVAQKEAIAKLYHALEQLPSQTEIERLGKTLRAVEKDAR